MSFEPYEVQAVKNSIRSVIVLFSGQLHTSSLQNIPLAQVSF